MIRSEDEKEISDEYITKGFRMVRLGVKTKRGRPTNTWKLAVTKNLKRLKRESYDVGPKRMAFLDRKIRTCLQRENAQIWLTATIFKNTANNTHNIFYSQIERTTFIASIRAIARDTKSQLILNIDVQITKYSTNNCDFSHFKCEHNKKKRK